ncbi:MAG: uL15 family ribosomal protein [Candidatus Marsarchaeota archaeon]|jgi:large subunit ribosomal protein L15|nr:uL15 family ribosomal protein [Candidatus Marsarchaeota archaeon]
MVIRNEKRKRKYLGTRRWGAGNIKNRRGAGDRGGVGNAGARKHKFTKMTAKEPEKIRSRGFAKWNQKKSKSITLNEINRIVVSKNIESIDLPDFKVLSNGSLEKGVKIRAFAFSKKAIEKIKGFGGEALLAKELKQ